MGDWVIQPRIVRTRSEQSGWVELSVGQKQVAPELRSRSLKPWGVTPERVPAMKMLWVVAPLVLASLGVGMAPSWAQPDAGAEPEILPFERYPTVAEITDLHRELSQSIPQLLTSGFHTDWRTPEQRQQRAALVAAWTEVDSEVAPFLGKWVAIEEDLDIFPTATPGVVCIVDTYLGGSEFEQGMIVAGALYTDGGSVLVLEGEFLGNFFVTEGEAYSYPYSHPSPLQDPADIDIYASRYPDVVEAFEAHGCLVPMP
jgi:hypothetical protein